MGNSHLATASIKEPASYKIISIRGRDLPKSYQGFVLAKWLRSLKRGNDFFRLIDSENFFTYYDAFIKLTLSRPNTQVRLAVLSDDNDVVLGFSIVEGKTLHYVFVQKDLRRQGIGFSILPKEIESITHLTKTGITFWTKLFPWAKFKPFILEGKS